jgi:hypothetical protein
MTKTSRCGVDWVVRAGQLTRGPIAPFDIYTNEFQPAVLGQR